jgi:2-phospho-L-lactate transferase/gluconeogenesis factor (CofD/UPF0052 family)
MNDKLLKTVVFSGGRGTQSIQQSLSGVSNTKTTYVINGYDSGLSTGEVRKSADGMLGPSDFRKAIVNIAFASANPDAIAAARVLDFRLPVGDNEAGEIFKYFDNEKFLMSYLSKLSPGISLSVAMQIIERLVAYKNHLRTTRTLDAFSPSDLALGNAFIAGAFTEHSDFQLAVDATLGLIELDGQVSIQNVTRGEDLWLAAISKSGLVCVEEGHFVTSAPPEPVTDLMLISRKAYFSTKKELGTWSKPNPDQISLLRKSSSLPTCNKEVIRAISEADLIIYGTGTLHSSLLPSYMTSGIGGAIASNTSAHKVLMVNGMRDIDIHKSLKRESAIHSTLRYLNPEATYDKKDLLSEIWVTSRPWDSASDSLTDVSEHDGFPVLELQGTVNSHIGVSNSYSAISSAIARSLGSRLAPSELVVSVVIPVLNEVDRLDELFREIERHTHTPNGALIDYVFVDGGSTDGSTEKLVSHLGSALIQLEESSGRQAAIFHGIARARGATVGVFHSDLEYSIDSFMEILGNAERSDDSLYMASRAHGAGSEMNLRRIYGNRNVSFWLSRLGGIAVATLLTLRIGRVVSDPLCGVYASRREILLANSPTTGELNGYVRTIRNCSRAGVNLVEMGIKYSPRRRQEGKKTRISHGLGALASAFF